MDFKLKKETKKMKKGIFILAAILAISCGKKGSTSGNSDQNNVANAQDPEQPKIISDEEYLKSMAINYSGSDLYGNGLLCKYESKSNKNITCEYDTQFDKYSAYYIIELSYSSLFKINKKYVKKKYECSDYADCKGVENSKYYNCKVSYKKVEYNTEYQMCDIYGIDYGFVSNINNKTIMLKSDKSYYEYIFSKY